jgi:hypothetical protein
MSKDDCNNKNEGQGPQGPQWNAQNWSGPGWAGYGGMPPWAGPAWGPPPQWGPNPWAGAAWAGPPWGYQGGMPLGGGHPSYGAGYGSGHGYAASPGPGAGPGGQIPGVPQQLGGLLQDDFTRGLLVGAAATFLLTNPNIQKSAISTIAQLWDMVQGGFAEMKESFHDAEAEIHGNGQDSEPPKA